jgi:hypothetical protein
MILHLLFIMVGGVLLAFAYFLLWAFVEHYK